MANSNYFIGTKTPDNAPIINNTHANMAGQISKLEFSLDSGTTWNDIDNNKETVTTTATEFIIREKEGQTVTGFGDMFNGCSFLLTLDGANWDTSNVTMINDMFISCSSLTSLDISNWDTSSVTTMYCMFYSCSSLTSLDVSGWDTGNVTNMYGMFYNCSSLTSLDVSNWDTGNVIYMGYMFNNCSSLTSLDVSNWNTSNVTDMQSVFNGCSSLTSLDVSNWNTSNVTSMSWTFSGCSSLTSLDVSNWDTSSVTTMYCMFNGCSSLTSLDVSNWDTSNVTNMRSMFNTCSSLTSVDVSNWDTSSVNTMYYMFYKCSSLTSLDVSNWDTSNVTDMWSLFNICSSLTSLDVSNWDTSNVTSMSWTFSGCSSLTSLDVSNWDTSNVINMNSVFNGCSSLTSLDVSNWDTSEVTTTDNMLNNVSATVQLGYKWTLSTIVSDYTGFTGRFLLPRNKFIGTKTDENAPIMNNVHVNIVGQLSKMEFSLDGGGTWADIDNNITTVTTTATEFIIREKEGQTVTEFGDMFNGCSSLLTLDANSWDTSRVTKLNGMFVGCSSLTSVDVSNWDTGNVTNIGWMFNSCSSLTSVDVSNWDTSNVNDMCIMFRGCSSLTSLDVSNWDTSSVTTTDSMLNNVSATVQLGYKWTLSTKVADYTGFTGRFLLPRNRFIGTKTPDNAPIMNNTHGNMAGQISKMEFSLDGGGTWADIDNNIETVTTTATEFIIREKEGQTVTEFGDMFNGCSSLLTLDVSNWDTINVTKLNGMFVGCSSLTSLDVSNWDTGNVIYTGYMFYNCSSLTSLDISNWDTSNVTMINGMFVGCSSLTSLDVSNWDTSNVTMINGMFVGCSSLTSLDVSNWDTSNVINMNSMFNGCSSLTSLDVSNWDTSNVTNMASMFAYCTSLETLNLPQRMVTDKCNHHDDLGNTSNGISMMFDNLNSIKELDVTGWDVSNCNNFRSLFSGCVNLNHIKGIETWTFNEPIGSTTHLMNGVGSYNDYHLYDLRNMITANPPQDIYNVAPFNNAKLDIIVLDTNWHLETGEGACGLLDGYYVLPWDDSPVNQYTLKITQPNTTVRFFMRDHDYTPNTKWDDGEVNSETTHTYTDPGIYRVVSNLYPNSTEMISGSDTTVLPIETAILGHSETYPLLSLYRLFRYCRHLISCDISDACGYISNFDMTSTFFTCTSLTDLKSPQRIDCKGNTVYLESMFNNNGLPYVDLSFLCNSSRVMYKTTFKDSKYSRLVLPKTIDTSFGSYIAYQYQGDTIDFTKTDTYSNVDDISFTNIYANIVVNENWPYETGHVYGLEAPYKVIKKASEDNIYTINITDPTREVKLNNRMAVSSPKTDWGDGVEDDKLSHVYTEAGHYTIVSNLLPGRNLGRVTERDKEWLLTAKLGRIAPVDMSMYFANAFNMTKCDLSNVDATNVVDASFMFKDNYSLVDIIWDTEPVLVEVDRVTNLDLGIMPINIDGENNLYPCLIEDAIDVTSVSYKTDDGVVEVRPRFDKETNVLTLDLDLLDGDNVSISYIKEELAYSGTSETSKLKSMRYMFGNCRSLKSINMSQWDLSNCEDMSHMFFNCTSLSEVKLGQGNSIASKMDFMFSNCYSLSNISTNGSSFKFTPESVSFMFANCIHLNDTGLTVKLNENSDTKNMLLKCNIKLNTDEASKTIIENNNNHGAKNIEFII